MSQTFSKQERLYKKIDIQELFSKGSSFYLYPFTVKFSTKSDQESTSVLVSVSKRNFKKAVDRNKIKRRIKEAYRLNKLLLDNCGLHVAFIYNSKVEHDFGFIEDKMLKVLKKLSPKKS